MLISLTFKTPDVVDDALHGFDDAEREAVRAVINEFVSHGEYVTITINTETRTAEVDHV